MKSRVLFLDYDGVVNTLMWNDKGTRVSYNFPKDNKVNNFQAVQWVSEFCLKCKYDIVVTSSWREDSNYKELIGQDVSDEYTGLEIFSTKPNQASSEYRGSYDDSDYNYYYLKIKENGNYGPDESKARFIVDSGEI